MGKSRRSKSFSRPAGAFALVAALMRVVASCSEPRPLVATVTDLPDASRRPDGVLVDPPAALPSAVAHADARGVVALREPSDVNVVRAFVTAFVASFVREDFAALDQALAVDATTLDGAPRGSRALILAEWRRRLQQLEYDRLEGVDVVVAQKIQRFDFDELGGPDEAERPAMMRPGDVYVRAPVEVPRIGPDKFFGDTLVMVLRRDDAKYKIVGYDEIDGK